MCFRFCPLLILLVLPSLFSSTAGSNVLAGDEVDPSGTWSWKFSNQSAIHTLKLKLEGDKLTGSIKNSQGSKERPIENATFANGTVRFTDTYMTRLGHKATATYAGIISEKSLKGTIEFKHPDRTVSVAWEADRGSAEP